MQADHVLAIDQGTTSTRAILFDAEARAVATTQRELCQHYPQPGWVEHDPEDIWRDTLAVSREALASSGIHVGRIAGIGITKPFDGNAATVGNGVMVALAAKDQAQVQRLYDIALANGGTDEVAHGDRGGGFYAGYFRDLDGNKLNAFVMPAGE